MQKEVQETWSSRSVRGSTNPEILKKQRLLGMNLHHKGEAMKCNGFYAWDRTLDYGTWNKKCICKHISIFKKCLRNTQILQQETERKTELPTVKVSILLRINQEKEVSKSNIHEIYPTKILTKEKNYIYIPSFFQLYNLKMLTEFPWVLQLKAWH